MRAMTDTTSTKERVTLKRRIAAWGIRSTTEWADENPNMEDSQNMNHWRVILRMGRKRLAVPFSTGYGITREPDASDVLECLALDAAGLKNAGSFEEWCSEYGYDTDSRRAERTYRAIERQSNKLCQFLGDDRFDALLWHTDTD